MSVRDNSQSGILAECRAFVDHVESRFDNVIDRCYFMYSDTERAKSDPRGDGAYARRICEEAQDSTQHGCQDGTGLTGDHAAHGAVDQLRVAGGWR